jgi:phosphate transport system protein
MPRKTFDRDLQRLQDRVLQLGGVVERAIVKSVDALSHRNREASSELIAGDRAINEERFAIEGAALTLIATQQPLAGDLRTLFAVGEIATELERVADYAKGIAKVNLVMGDDPLLAPASHLPHMAEMVSSMLHEAIQAFVDGDVALARSIPEQEHEVDAIHNKVYRELLALITADPEITNPATYLLWAVHNLERAADRVLNICERVIFNVTGEIVEFDLEEGEDLGLEGLS